MGSVHIDFHTHVVPSLPDLAGRTGDDRWPSFVVEGDTGQLIRDGRVVRTVPPSSWSPAARIEDMDAGGIDRQVLSPLPPLVCDWAEPDLATQWALHLNDSIASMVSGNPERFSGLGTVPLHDPVGAVAVLERAKQAGLDGVEIGTTAGALELDDGSLREFFAAAADLEMLVFVHPLILGFESTWTLRISGPEVIFGLGMTTDTAIAASKLVFGGVVEETPDLRICLAHGGGGFVWALPRIRLLWERGHDSTVADLTRNVFVDSVVYDSRNLAYLAQALGGDRILFGTDYPLPAQADMHGSALADLSPVDTAAAWGGNATRLLRSCC